MRRCAAHPCVAKLVPPAPKDQYEDEAYEMLELKAKQGKKAKPDLSMSEPTVELSPVVLPRHRRQ
jgi:hypothetical protein